MNLTPRTVSLDIDEHRSFRLRVHRPRQGRSSTILNDCTVSSLGTALSPPEKIECFLVEDGEVFLPKYYSENAKLESEEKHHEMSVRETTFRLREYQQVVEREVDAVMETYRSILLSLHCGWGKSYFAILYALKLGLQTLVTVYRASHLDQWRDSIRTVNKNLKVQVLENKTPKEEGMDFYLILGENLAHRPCREFRGVGTFIVDECQMFCTPSMSKSFMRVQPKYCMALSATPFRTDGLDSILSLHFGYGMVKRKLNRPFNVYQLKTKFRPSTQETKTGRLDWSHVMDSQASSRRAQRADRPHLSVLCEPDDHDPDQTRRSSGQVALRGAEGAGRVRRPVRAHAAGPTTRRRPYPHFDLLEGRRRIRQPETRHAHRRRRRRGDVRAVPRPPFAAWTRSRSSSISSTTSTFSKHFNTRMITYLNSGGVIKPFSRHFPECV
jgi:hypothetical protein